ncbi:hypothetical protein HDU76_000220 [Blyttiomyces sp. JEL0837]|nr:hypothetical protein HDU76_000220 [Blyttiomyces sp. JEL0837]
MAAVSAISFYTEEEVLKLADLIGTAKGEPTEEGEFVKKIKQLQEKEKTEEICLALAKESASLLTLDARDLEKVYNLLIAIISKAEATTVTRALPTILDPIIKSPGDKVHLKLKVLSNLYNSLPASSESRYTVFIAIVKFAAITDELYVLAPSLAQLETLCTSWDLGLAEKRELYLLLSQDLSLSLDFKQDALDYLVKYLATFEGADATALKTVKEHAIRAVKEAISTPTVYNFEDLFRLQAVQNLKSFREFVKANAGFIEKEGIVKTKEEIEKVLVRKMRLLTLASVAGQYVDGEMGYGVVAEALEIPESEVEIWVIDGIRAELIEGKMNQLKKAVLVSRSTHRVFSKKQWGDLSDRLGEWKSNLKELLQVLANAKLIAASQNPAVIEAMMSQQHQQSQEASA